MRFKITLTIRNPYTHQARRTMNHTTFRPIEPCATVPLFRINYWKLVTCQISKGEKWTKPFKKTAKGIVVNAPKNERMRTEEERHRIWKMMALPNKTGNDASGNLTSGLRCSLPIFPASFAWGIRHIISVLPLYFTMLCKLLTALQTKRMNDIHYLGAFFIRIQITWVLNLWINNSINLLADI